MNPNRTTLVDVTSVVIETLHLEDRASSLGPSTELFGSMPELDSLALLMLATSLEERFGFTFDDEDFTGEVFESIGSLAQFIDQRSA